MTEHSAAIFVFFFLAEYASIVLICIFSTILFLGGYLTLDYLIDFFETLNDTSLNIFIIIFQGLLFSLALGLKSCFLIFVFI
jgi:NADH-ubiquinone oxidoreductase chain 1